MTPAELLKPILNDGLRSINFFNGRLLSGEDLTREQYAQREANRRLGQAMGDGIAYGLEVAKADRVGSEPILTIQPGLAINRCGDTIRLQTTIDLSLRRPVNAPTTVNGKSPVFEKCVPPQTGAYVSGEGVYLLTIAPAQGTEGRAPVSGLNNAEVDCNTKYLVEGVQFRLLQINFTASRPTTPTQLRNWIAAQCFGVGTAFFSQYPFAPVGNQYGFQTLRFFPALADCDVPLGVIHWTATQIEFVDLWSVRRRLTKRATTVDWGLALDDRRVSEAEAMFLQFQGHIQWLRRTRTDLASVQAADQFLYLPPVGMLPLQAPTSGKAMQVFRRTLGNTSQSRGFDIQTFFAAHASRDLATLDGAQYRHLLHQSFSHEPVELAKAGKLQLYLLWENLQAVENGTAQQLVLIFASAALPYLGTARFGRAMWDVGRVAPAVI